MKRKNRRYMKLNFWKYAASVVFCIAAAASCQNSDPVQVDPDPVFPQSVINKTVAAGESVDITIEPNLAWEVQISGEGSGNMFWLDDDGMKATRISSKEVGSVTITVVFSDDEEFDVNRVCEVTLKMAGQSKKIAVITRPSLGRTFELLTGIADENGFTSEFGTETVKDVTLLTFPGEVSYSLPVRVVTNYAWNIALPSWLKAMTADGKEAVNAGDAGTTDILLTAVLSEDEINGAEGEVSFIDAVNTSVVNELEVSLPSFANRLEYEINSIDFNIQGQVLMPNGSYADGTAVAYVLAAKGFAVKALEWKGECHDTKYADWVNIQFGEYDDQLGPLQYIDVLVGVNENPGETRFADLFIFPVSMGDVKAEDICNMNDPACGFKEEYAKYYVGRLTQAGEVPPYITPISSEELRAEVGTYFSTLEPKAEDNILQWDFDNAQTYHKITYTLEWSADEASFECSKPYASVKLFMDMDYPVGLFTKEVTAEDNCWVSFAGFGANMKGRFNMNYVPESATHTAAVFYDETGSILSAVLVEYNPTATPGDEEVMFKITTGAGEIVKMDQNSDMYMAISGNFNVTDVYQITTNDKMIYVETPVEYWNVMAAETTAPFANYSGPITFEGASPNFYIYTNGCTARSEVIYVLQVVGPDGVSMVNHSAVHVIFDPDAAIEEKAPFSFVYPDYVNGMATLALHEGDMLETVLREQWGLEAKDLYELVYADASAASLAVLNVPGSPQGGGAWGNWPYSDSYWLTHEMNGTQMTIYMAEAGKTDYFVFYDSTGLPSCALVCTLKPEQ